MKFNFKIQQYQTEAVDAIVRVFNGQPNYDRTIYIRDLGSPRQISRCSSPCSMMMTMIL